MVRRFRRLSAASAALTALVLAGCGGHPAGTPRAVGPASTPTVAKADDEHGHKPSAHGGTIVSIGRNSYHAEAVFEAGGTLRLYMLGQDESKVLEVEAQALTAYAKPEGGMEATAFTLAPEPQPGDKPGMTSLFVGKLPADTIGKPVEVTIPNLQIGGERFRVPIPAAPAAHVAAMPPKVADSAERTLYLTPGGRYTEADIQANGGVTASVKFKGVRAAHDAHPKPGDKVCPVTDTKANPLFTWFIGGKPYEFCCPPCVDEFLQRAKERPGEIKDPDAYKKK